MTDIPTLAYIDPGSGTVLMQVILSGSIALLLFLRTRVLSFLWIPFRGRPAAIGEGGPEASREMPGGGAAPRAGSEEECA